MKLGVPKEVLEGETRVAVIPAMVSGLIKSGHHVFVETKCGSLANFNDSHYKDAGAVVVDDVLKLYQEAEVILKVNPPTVHPVLNRHEATLVGEGRVYIGFLAPLTEKETVQKFCERKITGFAMEYIPRITRAQSMDALSSMATLSGYKAVLIAANHIGKLFPLMMTAAGTVPPAGVFVLGAGVAGLQAIATAKRLGAKVAAFDPRPAVKEQVESLGGSFVAMELPQETVETQDGYAKEQTDEFLKKEREAIEAMLPKMDAVIATAQVFGKRAPLLITEEMLKKMKPGSVIVDLAAGQGGNCALTEVNQMVERYGVTIFGYVNLPARLPVDASQMYSKNIVNLVQHLYQGDKGLDFSDEITRGACITHHGEIVTSSVKEALQGGQHV